MKAPAVFAIVIGVIVGFLLGGLNPRRELSEAEKKIADLETRVAEAERRARSGQGGGGARFMPFFPDFERPTPAPTPTLAPGETPDPEATSTPFDPEEARRAFSLAADAQRMRARQSRQALEEKARLSHREMESVDRIIADMNSRLKEYADEMADIVLAGEEPDPRDLLELTHDVSGVLLDSQRAFEEEVGGGMGALDESSQEVWNYVDLETFREAFERASQAGTPQ